MLTKYPEIWLGESVMLVDLQTSSICCLPTSPPPFMLFFSGPVSPSDKRPGVQRSAAGPRRSNQLLLITLHSGGETQSLPAHTCTSVWRKSGPVSEGTPEPLLPFHIIPMKHHNFCHVTSAVCPNNCFIFLLARCQDVI